MDRLLFHLGDGWALGYDREQWIVLRGHNHKGAIKWNADSFVGGNKRLLNRIFREKGITLTPEAEKSLKRLPDTFLQWRDGLQEREAA